LPELLNAAQLPVRTRSDLWEHLTEERQVRVKLLAAGAVLVVSASLSAQEIVKVPQHHSRAVSRPDDLFSLPPGRWHVSKRLLEGSAPCTPEQCEAGLTSGDVVISAERSGEFVRIIAGFRGCEAVGSSEVEVGTKPGKPTFGRVREQMKRVLKGVSKTCKLESPALPALDIAQLFPPRSGV
jgi:hypothetical protein